MLESKKLELRRSEIRQQLATLAAKPEPTEDEVRSMESLDREYRTAETRYRAALVAEDEARREAGGELETRDSKEWAEMLGRFEVRQVAAALDHGHQIDGETAEIVQELRSQGAYQGIPVPWQALERRAGETIASGTPDPMQTRPIIDRLFPQSVASRMGGQMVNVGQGELEYPVATSGASVGWQASETGDVASSSAYATTDKPLEGGSLQIDPAARVAKRGIAGRLEGPPDCLAQHMGERADLRDEGKPPAPDLADGPAAHQHALARVIPVHPPDLDFRVVPAAVENVGLGDAVGGQHALGVLRIDRQVRSGADLGGRQSALGPRNRFPLAGSHSHAPPPERDGAGDVGRDLGAGLPKALGVAGHDGDVDAAACAVALCLPP